MQPFKRIRAVEFAGEDGLIFYADGIELAELNAQISALNAVLTTHPPEWLIESVPAYDSLMVVFDMAVIDYHAVYRFIRNLHVTEHSIAQGKTHRLPVWYGAPEANDLALVSKATGLSETTIIERHQSRTYNVYAVGFAPGFGYLGELDKSLITARLANPRKAVPAGAVAIADRQTAVYPGVSPGGWHLLGLCPVSMYNPGSDTPILLAAGDSVEFYAISEAQYRNWSCAGPEDS